MSFERPQSRGDLYFRLNKIQQLSRIGLEIGVRASAADIARMQVLLNDIGRLAEGAER